MRNGMYQRFLNRTETIEDNSLPDLAGQGTETK
jgi:hypothetical protein